MAGYWDDPEATAKTVQSGWLNTGDIGYFDRHDFLYLTDRSKDVIITGGSNVYPREVDEALLTHPAVHEAAVVGVPDRTWGESVRAYVVLVPGCQPETADLISHCTRRLASFKKPKSVIFVEELHKSPNGNSETDAPGQSHTLIPAPGRKAGGRALVARSRPSWTLPSPEGVRLALH